jgi:hypothetical protein
MHKLIRLFKISIFCFLCFLSLQMKAQQITGYWKGKIGNGLINKKLELKLIIKGDSIVGTSYYYQSKNNYARYSVKGFFNPNTNAVVWWDDVLLQSKQPQVKLSTTGQTAMMSEADFNCPGGSVMMLDGKAKKKDNTTSDGTTIHLDKTTSPIFNDEWNQVIDNWMVGGNNLQFIDSIQNIAFNKPEYEKSTPIEEKKVEPVVVLDLPVKREQPKETIAIAAPPKQENRPIEFFDLNKPNKKETTTPVVGNTQITKNNSEDTIKNITTTKVEKEKIKEHIAKPIESKFVERKKVILTEIPMADSIELHFYDNAEVDGDSISLFLDNQLLFEHIKLTDKPYIIKLNKAQLSNATELTMVAENLGSIPPNTSFMIAFVNSKRYEATLSSTEQTSAVIRFKK